MANGLAAAPPFFIYLNVYGVDPHTKQFHAFRNVAMERNDWDAGRVSPGNRHIEYPERVPFLHALAANKWEVFAWAPYNPNEQLASEADYLRATYHAVLDGATIGERPASRLWDAVAKTGRNPNDVFFEFEQSRGASVSIGPAPTVVKPPPSIIPEVWQPSCSVDTARAMDAVRAMSRGVDK